MRAFNNVFVTIVASVTVTTLVRADVALNATLVHANSTVVGEVLSSASAFFAYNITEGVSSVPAQVDIVLTPSRSDVDVDLNILALTGPNSYRITVSSQNSAGKVDSWRLSPPSAYVAPNTTVSLLGCMLFGAHARVHITCTGWLQLVYISVYGYTMQRNPFTLSISVVPRPSATPTPSPSATSSVTPTASPTPAPSKNAAGLLLLDVPVWHKIEAGSWRFYQFLVPLNVTVTAQLDAWIGNPDLYLSFNAPPTGGSGQSSFADTAFASSTSPDPSDTIQLPSDSGFLANKPPNTICYLGVRSATAAEYTVTVFRNTGAPSSAPRPSPSATPGLNLTIFPLNLGGVKYLQLDGDKPQGGLAWQSPVTGTIRATARCSGCQDITNFGLAIGTDGAMFQSGTAANFIDASGLLPSTRERQVTFSAQNRTTYFIRVFALSENNGTYFQVRVRLDQPVGSPDGDSAQVYGETIRLAVGITLPGLFVGGVVMFVFVRRLSRGTNRPLSAAKPANEPALHPAVATQNPFVSANAGFRSSALGDQEPSFRYTASEDVDDCTLPTAQPQLSHNSAYGGPAPFLPPPTTPLSAYAFDAAAPLPSLPPALPLPLALGATAGGGGGPAGMPTAVMNSPSSFASAAGVPMPFQPVAGAGAWQTADNVPCGVPASPAYARTTGGSVFL